MSDLPESGLQTELKVGRSIQIGPDITLFLVRTRTSRLRLVIRAPKYLRIIRSKAVLAPQNYGHPLEVVRETDWILSASPRG